MEIRELLSEYGFDGDETPIVCGSALCALENKKPEVGLDKIKELIEVIVTYFIASSPSFLLWGRWISKHLQRQGESTFFLFRGGGGGGSKGWWKGYKA